MTAHNQFHQHRATKAMRLYEQVLMGPLGNIKVINLGFRTAIYTMNAIGTNCTGFDPAGMPVSLPQTLFENLFIVLPSGELPHPVQADLNEELKALEASSKPAWWTKITGAITAFTKNTEATHQGQAINLLRGLTLAQILVLIEKQQSAELCSIATMLAPPHGYYSVDARHELGVFFVKEGKLFFAPSEGLLARFKQATTTGSDD